MIDSFQGEWAFLSNFYLAPIEFNGIRYRNSEAAFQAQKCKTEKEKEAFAVMSPSEAKKAGRRVNLIENWEAVKEDIMRQIVFQKFVQNSELQEKLLATGDQELIEGNWWKDTYWGVCNGIGKNKLGKILMEVREVFRKRDV